VWTTTLLFGAAHVANVFVTHQVRACLVQGVAAAMAGVLYVALRLRTGSLLPGVMVHGGWDLAVVLLASAPAFSTRIADLPAPLRPWSPLLLVTPFFLIGLGSLRGAHPRRRPGERGTGAGANGAKVV